MQVDRRGAEAPVLPPSGLRSWATWPHLKNRPLWLLRGPCMALGAPHSPPGKPAQRPLRGGTHTCLVVPSPATHTHTAHSPTNPQVPAGVGVRPHHTLWQNPGARQPGRGHRRRGCPAQSSRKGVWGALSEGGVHRCSQDECTCAQNPVLFFLMRKKKATSTLSSDSLPTSISVS